MTKQFKKIFSTNLFAQKKHFSLVNQNSTYIKQFKYATGFTGMILILIASMCIQQHANTNKQNDPVKSSIKNE